MNSTQFLEIFNLEPTGFIYLYFYPIFSSIIAGFIFWLIFSFFPERKRRQSFGVGVFNDLLLLNGQIFAYFDFLLRHKEHSPSFFQEKIHACSLRKEELSLALQNKVISKDYLYELSVANQMMIVGEALLKKVSEIDLVINRLYSFNYFLSTKEIKLLRKIHGNIHTYTPYIESNLFADKSMLPINRSISFMASSAFTLQEDFRELRDLVFSRKDYLDRDFFITKILRSYNLKKYKECIKNCKLGCKYFLQDANFFNIFTIQCYLALGNKTKAYMLLRKFPLKSNELIGYRNVLNPLLVDSEVQRIVIEKTSLQAFEAMKEVVIKENTDQEKFLSANKKLQKYFVGDY